MPKPNVMRDPFPPVAGMQMSNVIVGHNGVGVKGTLVPKSCAAVSTDEVGEFSQAGASLDACIRPLESLTREEVTALAVAAADNAIPLPRALPFEPGTQRAAWFISAYWKRDSELRAVEA
jgi:hypothetical protein